MQQGKTGLSRPTPRKQIRSFTKARLAEMAQRQLELISLSQILSELGQVHSHEGTHEGIRQELGDVQGAGGVQVASGAARQLSVGLLANGGQPLGDPPPMASGCGRPTARFTPPARLPPYAITQDPMARSWGS